MTEDSQSYFDRTLEHKTDEARDAVNECIRQYLAPTNAKRQIAAENAFDSVKYVVEMLHPNDRPGWLLELQQELKFAKSSPDTSSGVDAVQRIASYFLPALTQHSWSDNHSRASKGFEFDEIFEKHRSQCKIPELFDELIGLLKQIVDSGDIDSIRAIKELESVIETLKQSRNGSYFATRGAWYFAVMWMKNTGWELLGSVPIAGGVIKGLRKTLEQTDAQMQKMHEEIQKELEVKIVADFPRLTFTSTELPRIAGPQDKE